MHFLDRSSVTTPVCLADYDHAKHAWDDAKPCKPAIRAALSVLQGGRCAYCEAGIEFSDDHIEHFRRKGGDGRFRHLTFDWTNLFLSCDGPASCGHFKDKPIGGPGAYDPANLVKPDEHQPDGCLYFHDNGDVRPRSKATPADAQRGAETIRVFNLDSGRLRGLRRKAVAKYFDADPKVFEELDTWPDADRRAYIALEIAATATRPFATAIRHFLERYA